MIGIISIHAPFDFFCVLVHGKKSIVEGSDTKFHV
jgi:hypothetical protein